MQQNNPVKRAIHNKQNHFGADGLIAPWPDECRHFHGSSGGGVHSGK